MNEEKQVSLTEYERLSEVFPHCVKIQRKGLRDSYLSFLIESIGLGRNQSFAITMNDSDSGKGLVSVWMSDITYARARETGFVLLER